MLLSGKPGRVHITEKTLSFLNDLYTVEDGDGISRPENEGGALKSYFIVDRKVDILSCKFWNKDADDLPNSLSSLQDAAVKNATQGNDTHNENTNNGHVKKSKQADVNVDNEDVHLEGLNSSKYSLGDDNTEKLYMAKRMLSPTKTNLQKQLAKTPLPFPATFNFTYGITLNEALRRDALRASNDNQLVKLMHKKKIQKEYFFNPPLKIWSLNFKDVTKEDNDNDDIEMTQIINAKNREENQQQSTESKYRDEGFKGFKLNPKVTTFASPKVHFLIDIVACTTTLFTMTTAGLLLFRENLKDLDVVIAVIIICLFAMLCLLVYQCMKCSPSLFPTKISKCAALPDKENSENGLF